MRISVTDLRIDRAAVNDSVRWNAAPAPYAVRTFEPQATSLTTFLDSTTRLV